MVPPYRPLLSGSSPGAGGVVVYPPLGRPAPLEAGAPPDDEAPPEVAAPPDPAGWPAELDAPELSVPPQAARVSAATAAAATSSGFLNLIRCSCSRGFSPADAGRWWRRGGYRGSWGRAWEGVGPGDHSAMVDCRQYTIL